MRRSCNHHQPRLSGPVSFRQPGRWLFAYVLAASSPLSHASPMYQRLQTELRRTIINMQGTSPVIRTGTAGAFCALYIRSLLWDVSSLADHRRPVQLSRSLLHGIKRIRESEDRSPQKTDTLASMKLLMRRDESAVGRS